MILFIRHGKTRGNLEGRYVGRTDEPLCEAGIRELRARQYPPVAKVFASPMRRCIETTEIVYPGIAPEIISDFREIDFGDFEYKTYLELNGNPAYQAWVDSNGTLPFPNGESRDAFSERCVKAFELLLPRIADMDCAFVVHGGTIMAILERFAIPRQSYYDYQVKNGSGYLAVLTNPEHGELRVQSLDFKSVR